MDVPPHTIICVPDQTAVCMVRASGAPVVVVADQVFVAGVYRLPVLSATPLAPPHTTATVPFQIIVGS